MTKEEARKYLVRALELNNVYDHTEMTVDMFDEHQGYMLKDGVLSALVNALGSMGYILYGDDAFFQHLKSLEVFILSGTALAMAGCPDANTAAKSAEASIAQGTLELPAGCSSQLAVKLVRQGFKTSVAEFSMVQDGTQH